MFVPAGKSGSPAPECEPLSFASSDSDSDDEWLVSACPGRGARWLASKSPYLLKVKWGRHSGCCKSGHYESGFAACHTSNSCVTHPCVTLSLRSPPSASAPSPASCARWSLPLSILACSSGARWLMSLLGLPVPSACSAGVEEGSFCSLTYRVRRAGRGHGRRHDSCGARSSV